MTWTAETQKWAWNVINYTSHCFFLTDWKPMIVSMTSIQFCTLKNWETGTVNSGAGRMLPKMHELETAFTGHLNKAITLAVEIRKEVSESKNPDHVIDHSVLQRAGELLWGPSWKESMIRMLSSHYFVEITQYNIRRALKENIPMSNWHEVISSIEYFLDLRIASMEPALEDFRISISDIEKHLSPDASDVEQKMSYVNIGYHA